MNKRLSVSLLGLALIFFLPSCGSSKIGPWDELPSSFGLLLRNLEREVPELLAEHEVPGLSLTLIRDGELNASRGFGVIKTGGDIPVTEETIFEAASLGKPLFAYAVMGLVQKGMLDLDKPLVSYMPDVFEPVVPRMMAVAGDRSDPKLQSITARMVLSHRSGLPNWSRGKDLEFIATPGEKFGYSGEAYVYLQRVVEKITGTPIKDFMKKEIFEPLEMNSSSYSWESGYEEIAAVAHDESGHADPDRKITEVMVAYSLYTTAADYSRFLLAMLDPVAGKAAHLDPGTMELMLTSFTDLGDNLSWGLGWALEDSGSGRHFWHWGDNGEFKTFIMVNVETQTGLALFTNSIYGFRACAPIVRRVLGDDHPALTFRMVNY